MAEQHLFDGQIEGYDIYIDEQRTDSYSESVGSASYTKTYHLQSKGNALSLSEAKALFIIWVKASGRRHFHGYPITSCNVSHSEEGDLDILWDCELTYEGKAEDDLDYEKYKTPYYLNESFSTSGGTSHITQCWTDGQNVAGETVYQCDSQHSSVTSFNGRIGWNGETAEGCDVIRPAFSFQLHRKVPEAEMTTAYRQLLCLTTGCVNDDTYCGFSAGNLLLEGVNGQANAEYYEEDIVIDPVTGDVTWEPRIFYDLAFSFRGGLEFTGIDVAGATVNKKAHQYMWVYSQKTDDSTTGVTIDEPKCVVVNDVYPYADFTQLNIYGEQDNA